MSASEGHVEGRTVPPAIYMPALPGEVPSVYTGTPVEMVSQMAAEMGVEDVRAAVDILMVALVQARAVRFEAIGINAASNEELATMFIRVLLDDGVSRPIIPFA